MSMQLVKQPGRPATKPAAKATRGGPSRGPSRGQARGAHGPSIAVSAIPDKLYFRIGEVAKLCGVETYVLRFWESEFPQLRPNKGGTGQRLYRKRDVEVALTIRRLLYDEGFTIPGARQSFQQEARKGPGGWAQARAGSHDKQSALPLELRGPAPLPVKKLKMELRAILGMLSVPVGTACRIKAEREPHPAAPQLFGEEPPR